MKHADFIFLELLCFQAAFLLACFTRHGFINPYRSVLYRNTAIVTVFIQIFVILVLDVFHKILRRGYFQEFKNVLKTVSVTMLLTVFYLFAIQQGETFSRIVLMATGVYYFAVSYLARSVRKYYLRTKSADNIGKKSLVLITKKENIEYIISQIQKDSFGEFCLSGIILMDEDEEQEIQGIPVVANRSSAMEYICHDWVDEVFLDLPAEEECRVDILRALMDMSMVVHIRVGGLDQVDSRNRLVQNIGDCAVVTVSSGVLGRRDLMIKRLIDIAGGIVGCILTGILFIFLAPVIYIQSPGPIFFSQMRVGRNGRLFRIYKFRSMYQNAEQQKSDLAACNEMAGNMFKMENDPRIIGCEKGAGKGIGNFIRKYSLDEFPQFFNVLRGDMSLVGTRPPTVEEWERYHFRHRGRLSIKPGLTGLWQISGRSDIRDFEQVVALDREYIAKWSIGMDIRIILKTVLVVFDGKGAR